MATRPCFPSLSEAPRDAAFEPSLDVVRPLTGAVMEVGSVAAKPKWAPIVAQYQQPQHIRAIVQMVTTFVPLAAVFWLMYLSLAFSYVVTLLLAFPAAGLL